MTRRFTMRSWLTCGRMGPLLLAAGLAGWVSCDGRCTAADIIPPDRRIDWSPGVPGGIPTYPVGINVKDAPYNAKGDGKADDTAAIQRALNDCPDGKAVFLPEGTYKTSEELNWTKSVVLRGAGPTKTRIMCVQFGHEERFKNVLSIGTDYKVLDAIPLASGFERGSKQVTLANATKVPVGALVVIWQDNDPAVVGPTVDFHKRVASQMMVVTEKKGNAVTLSRPLYRTFRKDLHAALMAYPGVFKAGLENLRVERTGQQGFHNIAVNCAAYCWIKNVESYKTAKMHIDLNRCYACEVRDCYIHEAWDSGGGGSNYGVYSEQRSSDNLIENNAFWRCRHAMIIAGGASGNVYGYNYSSEPINEGNEKTTFLMSDMSLHGGCPYMNLFEGNIGAHVDWDNVWGGSRDNTCFRNYVERKSVPTCHVGMWAMEIQKENLDANIIGNILARGNSPADTWRVGFAQLTKEVDPRVAQTILRHGNVDEITGKTEWDGKIKDHTLPASLYLKAKPAFFGDHPWPAIGPDVEPHVGFLPAKDRYDRELSKETAWK